MTLPSYPPKNHDPKNKKHGRIKRVGKTTKSPPNSHVVERAVRIRERQRRQKHGTESLQRAGSSHSARPRRRRRSESEPARPRQKTRGTATPPAPPRSSGRGGSPPPENTRCNPRPPPSSPALLKGGKKKKKKSQEAKLPKKFPREGKSEAQKEQSLKGEKTSYAKQEHFQNVPTEPPTQKHKRHNMPLAQHNPYT